MCLGDGIANTRFEREERSEWVTVKRVSAGASTIILSHRQA